ncbi:LysR substrate-binding domain-containing protein [Paenarthrobacter sp. NPDC057981]|uniref:LysR substrate-binding domain-containing protein n=1 Tax=Paenarthrobacter sp. NPDC057981 TaxID=3346297 RepID=UPI0036DD4C8C
MDLRGLLTTHLKLRHLVIVLAIAEHGSLVRAAEELYLTQPALSRALSEAERAVGAALFERTGKRMVPTPAGLAYLEHSKAIVGHLGTLRRRVEELTDPNVGLVRIGAHVTGANLLIPRAIARFTAERPMVEVRLREAPPETLIQELGNGDLDLLVGRVTDHPSTSRLKLVPLYREDFRIVAAPGHPAHGVSHVGLQDLVEYPWVLPLANTPLRDELEDNFRAAGLASPVQRVESSTPATLRTLVAEAGYLALMPESMAVAEGGLQMLELHLSGLAQQVGLLLHADRPLALSAALLVKKLQEVGAEIKQDLEDPA